jgi:hypothetical protein
MSLTVAVLLLVAVANYAVGVRLTVLIPVLGVLFAPLPRALPALVRIYRVAGQLVAAIVGSPLPLAFRTAADNLIGMES